MSERDAFLAMVDQDVASARHMIIELTKEYGQNLASIEPGDDENDVICGLVSFLATDPMPDDAKFSREAHLASYLAVAIKMLHEARNHEQSPLL